MHMEDVVDASYRVDWDGNVDMNRDNDNDEEEHAEEEDE